MGRPLSVDAWPSASLVWQQMVSIVVPCAANTSSPGGAVDGGASLGGRRAAPATQRSSEGVERAAPRAQCCAVDVGPWCLGAYVQGQHAQAAQNPDWATVMVPV